MYLKKQFSSKIINQILWSVYLSVLCLLKFIYSKNLNENVNIVFTNSGPVRGQKLFTFLENKPYYSYCGIPYAEPPIEKLRFLPPVPVRPWFNIRDCFSFGSVCIQSDQQGVILGDEDCLFLNVYVPDLFEKSTSGIPVMVFIHSGAYLFASGNDDYSGPDFIINEEVIMVTMNHRLGALGFLSLNTPEYSGNAGLKDVQLSLQWIHKNIQKFGGDNNKITIFGLSSGSQIAHYLSVNEECKGLFSRVIQMSVSFFNWSELSKKSHLPQLYEFAQSIDETVQNHTSLVDFLISVDAEKLITKIPNVLIRVGQVPYEINSLWLPVIENRNATKPILQDLPDNIMLYPNFVTHIDYMTSHTALEGITYTLSEISIPFFLGNLDNNFKVQLPHRYFNREYNSSDYLLAAQKIRNFYFQNNVPIYFPENLIQFVKMISDIFQIYPTLQRLRLLSKKVLGNVFHISFDLNTKINFAKHKYSVIKSLGACHADDLAYIIKCSLFSDLYDGVTIDSPEYGYIKLMTQLYTNFAKYGNPTPFGRPVELKSSTEDAMNYLNISMDGLYVAVNNNQKYVRFWDQLIEEFPSLFTETY